jgi:ATP-dependent Lhr-like helicase
LETGTFSNLNLALRGDAAPSEVAAALRAARGRFGDDLGGAVPEVSERALKKLKFSELLPTDLAVRTLAARTADHGSAARVARRPVTATVRGGG